jgi:hypothetical protein
VLNYAYLYCFDKFAYTTCAFVGFVRETGLCTQRTAVNVQLCDTTHSTFFVRSASKKEIIQSKKMQLDCDFHYCMHIARPSV